MLRTIVFDFDGVLVDSNALKYEAFFHLFPGTAPVRRAIRGVLERGREQTRHAILEAILGALPDGPAAGPSDTRRRVEEYAERYNEIVEAGVARCPEVPGARDAVEHLCREGRALYVNSTTPGEPLRRLLRARDLSPFFTGVYGGEQGKESALREVLRREEAAARDVLVVGDGETDREAAARVGCLFVGVRNAFNRWSEREASHTMSDLRGLRPVLGALERSLP